MNKLIANKIFSVFYKQIKNPKTELEYNNNFTFLIAVILSAQARDNSVNKATKTLFKKYNTPEKMLKLGVNNLKLYIKSIGLYNNKSINIINLCKILITKYKNDIPDNFNELIKLPGVGNKTANVVLNHLFNKCVIAVDTHVARVSFRLGLSTTYTNFRNIEIELSNMIPKKWQKNAHNWLVLHGRYICKSRKPLCEICDIKKYCQYYYDLTIKN